MTFKLLVSTLCVREGKKRQVNVAQMSEVTRHVLQILYEMPAGDVCDMIVRYGKPRRGR